MENQNVVGNRNPLQTNYWAILSFTFLVIIILFIVGGTVFYTKNYKPSLECRDKLTLLPTPSPILSNSKEHLPTSVRNISTKNVDTASWKTFSNKTYEITFKYPQEMVAEETKAFLNYKDKWGVYLWFFKEEFDYCHRKDLPPRNECAYGPDVYITRIEEENIPRSYLDWVMIDNKEFLYRSGDSPLGNEYYLSDDPSSDFGLTNKYSMVINTKVPYLHTGNYNFAKILSTLRFIQ